MTREEREGLLSKHRFMVQSKTISNETFADISNLPLNERADKVTIIATSSCYSVLSNLCFSASWTQYQRVWESNDKDDKKNHKLKVEFVVVENASSGSKSSRGHSIPSVSENVESVRSRLAQVDTATALSRADDDMPGSPEAMFAELQSLRKKYDAVVEYTVHLTAERDYHFTQLEDLRREYAREKARKKTGGETTPKRDGGKGADKVVQQGFSFIVVVLVAVISFLVARYMQTS